MNIISEWVLRPFYQYQIWVLKRELHIAQDQNPLVRLKLVWDAIKTALPWVVATLILFMIAWPYRALPHVASIIGDIIAALALLFGLTRNRDTSVLNAIKEACRHAKVNDHLPSSHGYEHVEKMVGNFRQQLRFYNSAIVAVNLALFCIGIVVSFM